MKRERSKEQTNEESNCLSCVGVVCEVEDGKQVYNCFIGVRGNCCWVDGWYGGDVVVIG